MVREIFNEYSKQMETYVLEREMYEVSNGKFYLYKKDNVYVVIKELKEKYDIEGAVEVDKEVFSYNRLRVLEIKTPKLLGYNRELNIVIKEYLEGENLLNLIKNSEVKKETFIELLQYSETINSDNLNIDYFPANFVIKDDSLYYVNYKVFPYTEELNLRNWGIYYWLNNEGIKKFIETGKEEYINISNEKNPIINEELTKKRDELYREYVSWKHKV